MKLRPLYENEYGRIQEIEPFSNYSNTTIIVSQGQEMLTDEWKPTEINWPGCGAHNSQGTLEFADALKYAVDLAQQWDAERVK